MRLSGLVVAAILLVSVTLLAQHSSGGGGSSSGGSHGGYSGASSSYVNSAGSHTSSGSASHVASASASSHPSPSSKVSSTKGNAALEKKSSRSLLHPFRKPKLVQSAEFKRPVRCLKGPCPVCPLGQSRDGNGACVVANNVCSSEQSWNGFACAVPYWSNGCEALAEQLAVEEREMRGQNDPGQSLRYRVLQDQYEQCLMRSRLPFGTYAFDDAILFDLP